MIHNHIARIVLATYAIDWVVLASPHQHKNNVDLVVAEPIIPLSVQQYTRQLTLYNHGFLSWTVKNFNSKLLNKSVKTKK